MRIEIAVCLIVTGSLAAAQSPSESVLLPAREYQKLLDELEQAKKTRGTKPTPPSECAIECELQRNGERPVALVTVTYQFRTTQRRVPILLGGQKAFAVKATLNGDSTPALEVTPEGLVAQIEAPGEHKITVIFETPIIPRGIRGEVGLEIGLPRAAITTLNLAPAAAPRSLTLSTREKPGELKTITLTPTQINKLPLGATDLLELTWSAPQPSSPEPALDVAISVRVEESVIETNAELKLHGSQKEWRFTLPAGIELTGRDVTIVRPANADIREWKVTLPPERTEAVLTATLRQPRDARNPKPVIVGPYSAAGEVRHTGTIRLYAGPNVRLMPRPGPDLRRYDPGPGEDDPIAAFRFSLPSAPSAAPLLEFDARTVTGFIAAQPTHKLSLTPQGWKLRSEYRIAPVRQAVEELTLDLPGGWHNPTFSPLELVDEALGGGEPNQPRQFTLRLAAPQREPFELILEARWPLTLDTRETSILLPRLAATRERNGKLTASVPETLDVTGSVRTTEAGKLSGTAIELKRTNPHLLTGAFDDGPSRVDLSWQPYRATLAADIAAEVTLQERQLSVTQHVRLSFPDGAGKAIRLTTPLAAVGVRIHPPLEALGLGEWSLVPPPGAKEAKLTLSFSLPLKLPQNGGSVPVPLAWPEATTAATTLRVWTDAPGYSVTEPDGPWRVLPPELPAERETWPALTLTANGVNVPLALVVAEADPTGSVIVDRAVYQWWMTEDGNTQGRARYLLKRWPTLLDLELPGATAVTALVDQNRIETQPGRGDGLRLVLPDPKSKRTGLLLELRFLGPTAVAWKGTPLDPPRLRGAIFRQPAWWQLTSAPGAIPITYGGRLHAVLGWHWSPLLEPAAGITASELDRWLLDGSDTPTSPGERAITARQSLPAPVTILRIPRGLGWLLGSGATLIIGWLTLRSSLRRCALLLSFLALGAAALGVAAPLILAQWVVPVQIGVALLLCGLGIQAIVRHWLTRRSALPFRRGTPISELAVPPAQPNAAMSS